LILVAEIIFQEQLHKADKFIHGVLEIKGN